MIILILMTVTAVTVAVVVAVAVVVFAGRTDGEVCRAKRSEAVCTDTPADTVVAVVVKRQGGSIIEVGSRAADMLIAEAAAPVPLTSTVTVAVTATATVVMETLLKVRRMPVEAAVHA